MKKEASMRARMRELAVLLALLSGPAGAAEVNVTNAWIRALPAHLPAGGYFTLKNLGGSEVSLTGASSPACGMLMLHKSSDASGMSSMSDVESIPVPAGGTVMFAPGGYHLMCMEPAAALKPGAKALVTLVFSDGTKTTTMFAVKDARGK
jgi:copper(I)-binding protein